MYSFTSRVRYSEIDESGALSITSLIDYLQDCSTFHSDSLGLGLDHSAETGYAWLLSAWEIEIRALPHFGDEIRVGTWPPTSRDSGPGATSPFAPPTTRWARTRSCAPTRAGSC